MSEILDLAAWSERRRRSWSLWQLAAAIRTDAEPIGELADIDPDTYYELAAWLQAASEHKLEDVDSFLAGLSQADLSDWSNATEIRAWLELDDYEFSPMAAGPDYVSIEERARAILANWPPRLEEIA